jgi:hypothetical protein
MARAIRQIAVCWSAAIQVAVAMGFVYTWLFAYTLDSSSRVVAKMSTDDFLKSLPEWLPTLSLYALLAGATVFWTARQKPSVRRWAIVAGSFIGAALLASLLLGHRFLPWTWLDYSTEAVGLTVACYLLFSNSLNRPQATGLIVAAGLGLLCIAGQTGAENARWTALSASVVQIDPATPVCRERDLERGQAVIVSDPCGKQQYRFKLGDDNIPYCYPKS